MREGGVQVIEMPLGRLRATANPSSHVALARGLRADVRRLTALIQERNASVVQVHGPTNPQAAVAARVAGGTAVVWQLLDTRAPMPLRRLAMPLVTRTADCITAWGDALIAAHPGAARLGSRTISVYPPVDTQRFAPNPEARARARTELGIAPDEVLVVSVGVLNPQKGHESLAAAMRIVRRSSPLARLRIFGAASPAHPQHGRMVAELARSADGADAVIDPVGRVAELLQAADIFALASVARSEGMPTAILEAMAAGKPIVATDVAAVSELVDDGRTGSLVPPGAVHDLAAALQRQLADDEMRRAMGGAGLERARAKFGLEELADRHARAYHVAVDYRHRRGAQL